MTDTLRIIAADQAETHPGAQPDADQRDKGWREGVADAWRITQGAADSRECWARIAALGNTGPQTLRARGNRETGRE